MSNNNNEFIQVTTTIDSQDLALQIAENLVKNKLAACAQISGPITSVYEWKEKVERDEEWYCIIKTRKDLFKQIAERIKFLHPYEVPEIIAIPIVNGHQPYLEWINSIVKKP